MPKGIIYSLSNITIGLVIVNISSLSRVAFRSGERRITGKLARMKRFFIFGGIIYTGIGSFLTLAVYLRGNDSAYTSDQNWSDALVVGLTWPWQLLQHIGVVA